MRKRDRRKKTPVEWLGIQPLEPRLLLSVVISEFMARNTETLADQDGEFSDWFELLNTTGQAIDLTGWHVTDDAADLTKWTIPAITLQPGEHKVLFASGKDRTDPLDELHTNFGLNDAGEYFALVEADGVTVAHAYDPYPAQEADISYGISIDSSTLLLPDAPLTFHVPTLADDGLGTGWTAPAFDDSAWIDSIDQPGSTIVISEAYTGGTDFIEIQNVADESVDTSGWVVALNDANGNNINNFHASVWQLPTSIGAGETHYRTDSATDNFIGENIFWSTSGNGWAMIVDNVGNIVDFVVWGYTLGEVESMNVNINGFDITIGDAWTGPTAPSDGTSSTSLQRTGSMDHNNVSDFAFTGPTSRGVLNAGLNSSFPGTSAIARTGIGFSPGASGFTVNNYQANITVNNITEAEGVIATPSQQASVTTQQYSTVNFLSTGVDLHYGNNDPYPGMQIGVDDNNFVTEAIGSIYIPSAGDWTFGVDSDDGFSLDITGAANFHIEFPGVRGAADTLGVFNVPEAGVYDVRLVSFERVGGASLEFFAAPGSHAAFNGEFDLVGDVANGGLEFGGFSDLINTDVQDQVQGINSSLWTRTDFNVDDPTPFDQLTLNMHYNDGFIAYLNGVEVASRNAPGSPAWNSAATASRSQEESIVAEAINLTSHLDLLTTGNNVLAVHVLNVDVNDDDLLMLPTLEASSSQNAEQYFITPTPGAANEPGFFDFVADTKFSVDRGFFDTAFDLVITTDTEGATIVYTLDGTEPTLTNGTTYTGPINISQTTTLRAAAFKAGFQPSNIDTQTYFFLADVLLQSPDGSPPPNLPASWGSNVVDYGMDPDIVNDPVWGPQLIDAFTQNASISIVTDEDNLFDPGIGIYANPGQRGRAWERPASVELIDPNDDGTGATEFQVDAGIRIRGGFSRSTNNPKHAFRLFFRGEYGDTKLEFPLFEGEGVDEFDKVDLRTAQNYSWSFQGNANNAFMRDILSRDIQGAMGHQYTRGRFYHLYVNGHYWGIFQTEERPSASFAESYYGGAKEDYDVVKSSGSPGGYTVEATDGTLDAWLSLYNLMLQDFANDDIYLQAQGLNPDGTNNPLFDRLLDIDNLIDHMIIVYYTRDRDGAATRFVAPRTNNWFGIYDRRNPDGFKFFEHDSEHSLDRGDPNMVSPKYIDHGAFDEAASQYWNPHWLHEKLMDNSNYRQRFIDRVYMHLSDGGVLSTANLQAMLDFRSAQIDTAIIAESARWGDAKRAAPFTKADWDNVINNIRNWFVGEGDRLISQLQAENWWSDVSPPEFRVNGAPANGGSIQPTDDITLFSPTANTIDTTAVAAGSTWNYLDDASDQGTAWRALAFDDASWESGPAQLGYGDGDEVTVVDFVDIDPVTAGVQKNATTYFRHTFNLADVSNIDAASIGMIFDDGVSVYLNGTEVIRENLTGFLGDDTVMFDTYAIGGAVENNVFLNFSIDHTLLQQGENILAVEIHQINNTSSDISFDLELITSEVTFQSVPIYYTLDGSDPRLPGGALNPSAIQFTGTAFNLSESTTVYARVLDNGVWSPLSFADLRVNTPADATNFALTEINYNPYAPSAAEIAAGVTDEDQFEFVEFQNISDERIDLAGVVFEGGDFTFLNSNVTALDPGEFVLIVRDQTAFEIRFGATGPDGQPWNIAGEYSGGLSNSGETISVAGTLGVIHDFDYNDGGAFPGRADGRGSSLEIITPGPLTDYNAGSSWRSSSEFGGTPGEAGAGPDNRVVINEVLAHTDLPQKDSIELFNTTGAAIDISGWYLSDDDDDFLKFRIPGGTILAAGGYIVFDEDDFNTSAGVDPKDFALDSAHGDDVFLIEATLDATDISGLLRFVDRVDFGATANGESLGRFPNGAGKLAPMLNVTLGSANGDPRIGPVVISEVMYHPPDPGNLPLGVDANDLEFVEIHNSSGSAVDLTGWVLDNAVDFDFPAGLMLGSEDTLLILAFDPTDPLQADKVTAFEDVYGVTLATLNVVGGFIGQLGNGGDDLQLHRADDPPAEEPQFTPLLDEDEVEYDDTSPWPISADGLGDSLHRVAIDSFGNFSTSWQATAPTPGVAIFGGDTSPPTVLSVTYNNGDAQRSMLTSIALAFSEQIATSLSVDDLQLVNVTTGQTIGASDLQLSWDDGSHVATWLFPNFQGGSLTDGDYVITVASQDITDESGNHLDGNGDGAGSGSSDDNWQGTVWRFFGDVDADRSVTNADLFSFRQAFGTAMPNPNYNPDFDADADAQIANADLFPFRLNFGASLDAPPLQSQNLLAAPLQSESSEPAAQPLATDGGAFEGSDDPAVVAGTADAFTSSDPVPITSPSSSSFAPSAPTNVTSTDSTLQQLQPLLASLAVEQRRNVDPAVHDAETLLSSLAAEPDQSPFDRRRTDSLFRFRPASLTDRTGIAFFEQSNRRHPGLTPSDQSTAPALIHFLLNRAD